MSDRRVWSEEESDALIIILQDMVVGGNKIRRLREKYTACHEMLDMSGFEWNDVRMCVEVDSLKWQNCGISKTRRCVGATTLGSTPGTTPATTPGTTTGSDGATISIAATEVTIGNTITNTVKRKKRMKDSEVFANYMSGMDKRWEQEREDTTKIFEIVAEDVKKRKIDDECVYAKIHDEMVRLGLDDKVIVDAMFILPRNTEYIQIFWQMDEGKRVRLAHKLANMKF
ncbi:hypothetical protein Tsubulata_015742 [Turnera subulata]|uniref:Myb/SANT-like domain-containing protein n=1 Tax=Turnera subulata TaxID=218843 RepID=A0A9Q0F8M0_9ROSI|nr:hypothetical protein Tsubulata_015742 [Turnera subulata]